MFDSGKLQVRRQNEGTMFMGNHMTCTHESNLILQHSSHPQIWKSEKFLKSENCNIIFYLHRDSMATKLVTMGAELTTMQNRVSELTAMEVNHGKVSVDPWSETSTVYTFEKLTGCIFIL